eukprot:7869005-Lingulodinium_polyedra.AAC.1
MSGHLFSLLVHTTPPCTRALPNDMPARRPLHNNRVAVATPFALLNSINKHPCTFWRDHNC